MTNISKSFTTRWQRKPAGIDKYETKLRHSHPITDLLLCRTGHWLKYKTYAPPVSVGFTCLTSVRYSRYESTNNNDGTYNDSGVET